MRSHLMGKPIAELSQDIKDRQVKVTDIIHEALSRIDAMNNKLHAFITVNPKAEALAREADRQISAGHYLGPLHGIPIGVKDMIDTCDMKTTKGSPIYQNDQPEQDAEIVRRLKANGAIIIGKTNTHQFAYGPTGDRSYYGPMRNLYSLTQMAGSSSGGSASSVASGLDSGAIGTDTSGSIRVPSSFCGLVGMKPTYQTVSLEGIYPLAGSLDDAGPMTRTIQDNAIMLHALKNNDVKEDFAHRIGKNLSGMRIGVPRSYFFDYLNPEVRTAVETACEHLAAMGADIRDVPVAGVDEIWGAQKVIIAYEARQVHEQNLADYPDMWDEEVQERLAAPPGYEAYQDALAVQEQSRTIFEDAMEHVDSLLTPTVPVLPPAINQRYVDLAGDDTADQQTHIRSVITKLTAPMNANGLPSLTMPSGFSVSGMPVGTQFIGKANDEARIYQIGYALEQSLQLDLAVKNV